MSNTNNNKTVGASKCSRMGILSPTIHPSCYSYN